MITSPAGVLAVLAGIAAALFLVQRRWKPRLFDLFPPLLFIYALPILLTNLGVTPAASPAYDVLKTYGLPAFLVLMLIDVDVGAAVKVMGKGVIVMLVASVGVVVGALVAFLLVGGSMGEGAPAVFGALAGSWIGGTGNMAAAGEALGVTPAGLGLAVLADTVVYVVWLPIMLGSKRFAAAFARWSRVDPERVARMEAAAAELDAKSTAVTMTDLLVLATVTMSVVWIADAGAAALPELGEVVSRGTWRILLVTSLGVALSFTPVRRVPGTQALAMALIYVFVASMGARASRSELGQAPAFLAGAFVWIFVHGAFCLLAARLFRVDVATAAIASAANIGGAASAPIVAAYHNEALVPVSVLMALIGYAIGNYLAILTGQLCALLG